ncbi:hypothetical protein FHS26_006051 [Rhizobium pisi]|uniref:Uncharacterized protein n=1 Tax=Rhizobium pisi TaxID=574561 RepID=A0A7W5G2H8_9HYPH|nr:hypothetical protein [Rhizobium pisi]MBB3138273.1 hypothetical protein [Rhizobium pisi]
MKFWAFIAAFVLSVLLWSSFYYGGRGIFGAIDTLQRFAEGAIGDKSE